MDVVGLYLDPPEHALVLCVDEKSEIQAYIDSHYRDPKPFMWTTKVQDILEKVGRARAALDKIASD